MNVAQKTWTITRLPQFFAIHKIGGTRTDLQHTVQVNKGVQKYYDILTLRRLLLKTFHILISTWDLHKNMYFL